MRSLMICSLLLFYLQGAHGNNCDLVYDEFDDLMNKQFLLKPESYTKGKKQRLSRAAYQRQRKVFLLNPQRGAWGIGIIHTNSNQRGKFLFEWKRNSSTDKQPTLWIREATIYGRVLDGNQPRTFKNIAVRSSYRLDLDTGKQGGDASDIWFHNVNGKEMYVQAVNGAKLFFPTQSLCQKTKPATAKKPKPNLLTVPINVTAKPTLKTPDPSEKKLIRRELLANGDVQLTYSDKSKKIMHASGGFTLVSPNGEKTTAKAMSAPVDFPGNPPGDSELAWLNGHRDNLLNIITTMVDNPDLVNEFVTNIDTSGNLYESIYLRSQVIERLTLE